MFRALLCAVPVLVFVAGGLPAADDKADKKDDRAGVSGVVVKVDTQTHAVTIRLKDADGKEVEKTFPFGAGARVTDESGKASGLDVVSAGDEVIVVEKNGGLSELRLGARGEHHAFNADRFLERFDKNKDGFIQREELPERYRHAFDQIDLNKDGKLDREELAKGESLLQRQRRPADFLNVLVEMSDSDESCQKELQYAYDLLRKMDKNQDGKLDPVELKEAREQLIAGRVDEIIKDLDGDNDGKISKEEARGRLKRDFDKIDQNKDGFLDREELLKAAHERAEEEAAEKVKEKEASPAPKPPASDR